MEPKAEMRGGEVSHSPSAEEWDQIERKMTEERRSFIERWLGKVALNSERPQSGGNSTLAKIQNMIGSRNKKRLAATEAEQASVIVELSNRESKMREALKKEQIANMLNAARAYKRLGGELTKEILLLNIATESSESSGGHKGDVSDRDANTDYIRNQRDKIKQELAGLANISRDTYYVAHGLELRENLKELKSGDMVNTPYVRRHKDILEENMEAGHPTYVYGHLGSGKTELAISAAKEVAMKMAAREEAIKDIEDFFEKHPDELEDEDKVFERLTKAYQANLGKFSRDYKNGDKETVERFMPLVISGSKDLTTQDLYTEKSLKLAHFNGKSLGEHKAEYDREFEEWKIANDKRYEGMSEKERAEYEQRDALEFFDLYKMKNQAFGTEVEIINKEIYRGIQEGRPVIIDEANVIPAGVLISLNDILQRRPGDNCYVPGIGSIKMKPGFSITMTGNPSSGRNEYVGTNDFNTAFSSRLAKIEYGYLPQSAEGSFRERNPKEDELYRVMIAYLSDNKGNLQLPEINKNVEKLYSLAQLASLSQKIFSGEDFTIASGGDEKTIRFEKSVLSVRNMLEVLRKWNKGADMDLDAALYQGFIAGMMDENERNAMLQLAHDRYGFFDSKDGWRFVAKEYGESCTFGRDNIERLSLNERKPLETYITAEVVDLVFGERPKREIYPDIDLDEIDTETTEGLSDEQYTEILEKEKQLEQVVQALEVLAEQCGCSNEGNGEQLGS